jgi:type IV pilus assembly protein PilY1
LIGTELWAYIPSNRLAKLKELARQTYGAESSCVHRFMVDLSPQAWDVFIDPDGIGPEARQWRTVLLGGERGGGDVYFAVDVTNPDSPTVLWEFPAFRNMVQVHENGSQFTAVLPYLDRDIYEQAKGLPMSWSIPYVGKLQLPTGVSFLAANPISSWENGTPSISLSNYDASNLSGWFAVIGSGPRIFKLDDLPVANLAQKKVSLEPNLLMIDIEKGVNIFQYNWPLMQGMFRKLAPTRWPEQPVGSNYIPYSVANTLAFDIWDASGGLFSDGYMDHIYFGDLNGLFYSL